LELFIFFVSLAITMTSCNAGNGIFETEPTYYDISINVDGEGNTKPEPGTYEYKEDETIALEAIPDEGWEFSEWTGSINSTDREVEVIIDSDKSVTAVFEKEPLEKEPLAITKVEEITAKSVEHNTVFGDIGLPEKVGVTLCDYSTAALNVSWLEGDYDGETAGVYIIAGELALTDDIINPDNLYPTVQVTVKQEGIILYSVSVKYDEDKGTVKGYGSYEEGVEVELTAKPAEGYEFVEWTGYITGTAKTITFEMPAEDVKVTAIFEEKMVEVKGRVKLSKEVELEAGEEVVVNVYANGGSDEGVILDEAGSEEQYTIGGLELGEEYTFSVEVDKVKTSDSILDRTGSFTEPSKTVTIEEGDEAPDFIITANDLLMQGENEFVMYETFMPDGRIEEGELMIVNYKDAKAIDIEAGFDASDIDDDYIGHLSNEIDLTKDLAPFVYEKEGNLIIDFEVVNLWDRAGEEARDTITFWLYDDVDEDGKPAGKLLSEITIDIDISDVEDD